MGRGRSSRSEPSPDQGSDAPPCPHGCGDRPRRVPIRVRARLTMTYDQRPATSPRLILGIETSCDETAAAVVEDGRRLRSNVIASQFHLHAQYGGVVPEVASRHHLEVILQVVDAALAEAGAGWRDLAAVAVTAGPGLAGALLVGVNTAKALAYAHGLPLLGVNHLEAHLYANWLEVEGPRVPRAGAARARADRLRRPHRPRPDARPRPLPAPRPHARRRRRRGLRQGRPPARPRLPRRPGDRAHRARRREAARCACRAPGSRAATTSRFSGLKTAVLHIVRGESGAPPPVPEIAAAFQASVVDVLTKKAVQAAAARGRALHPALRRRRRQRPAARDADRALAAAGVRAAARPLHRQRRDDRRLRPLPLRRPRAPASTSTPSPAR